MARSFLFYDLETFGKDPCKTRVAQFAAIRTDTDLRPVGPTISFYIQPADDLLPSPHATCITKITPQHAKAEGIIEADAFAKIYNSMMEPETCTLGYNSLRFDDNFIRYGLYRNFFDPYAREWSHGNTRSDILDILRCAYALRPYGITWPLRDNGLPSFRLEDLALANQARDGQAHEATSDVLATIAMARLVRQHQPRLWEYCLSLRYKNNCAKILQNADNLPVLHFSAHYGAKRMCVAAVLVIGIHPHYAQCSLAVDLDTDIDQLLDILTQPSSQIAPISAPYTSLPSGIQLIHHNRCQMLVCWQHLRQQDFDRLAINHTQILEKAKKLRPYATTLQLKLHDILRSPPAKPQPDADASLYEGFLGESDRRVMADIRRCPPEQLASMQSRLKDTRLHTLLARYQARNWPNSLQGDAENHWQDYRKQRLVCGNGTSEYTLAEYDLTIQDLRTHNTHDQNQTPLLDALEDWGKSLRQGL